MAEKKTVSWVLDMLKLRRSIQHSYDDVSQADGYAHLDRCWKRGLQKEVTSDTKAEDKTGERSQGKANLKENSEREQMGNSRNIWGAFLFNYISLPG